MKHWRVEQVSWDRFDPSKLDPEIIPLVKAAAMVERNGDDYALYLKRVFRDDPDFHLAAENWADPVARSVALFIDGSTDPDVAADGTPMIDDDFLMLINSWWQPLTFTVPADLSARHWHIVCDTFDPSRTGNAGPEFEVGPRSAVVLRSGS